MQVISKSFFFLFKKNAFSVCLIQCFNSIQISYWFHAIETGLCSLAQWIKFFQVITDSAVREVLLLELNGSDHSSTHFWYHPHLTRSTI